MAAKNTKTQPATNDDRVKRAYGIMAEIRAKLYRRLADYVLTNENRIRNEAIGEESYSFSLQQMEDMFLNKLNVVERAVAELARGESRENQTTTTTYETVEVIAKREDLPQKVADALAEHGESDLLDICVLRADDKQAEILLVMAREDTAPPQEAQATPPPPPAPPENNNNGGIDDEDGS